jgi:hypothetical protein
VHRATDCKCRATPPNLPRPLEKAGSNWVRTRRVDRRGWAENVRAPGRLLKRANPFGAPPGWQPHRDLGTYTTRVSSAHTAVQSSCASQLSASSAAAIQDTVVSVCRSPSVTDTTSDRAFGWGLGDSQSPASPT